MLTSDFKTPINEPFYKSFDTIFMKNIKSCKKLSSFLFYQKKKKKTRERKGIGNPTILSRIGGE